MSAGRRRGASLADEIAELLDARPSDPTAEEDEIGGGDGGFDERRELLADEDMRLQTDGGLEAAPDWILGTPALNTPEGHISRKI